MVTRRSRQRLGAVVKSPEWQLLTDVIWRATPGHALAWWVLVVARSVLPGALAVGIGLLISSVSSGSSLLVPLAVTGSLFVVSQVLGPLHAEVGWTLGSRTGAWLYARLVDAAVEPEGIAHLEDPEFVDDLRQGREFDLGTTGPDMAGCMAQVGQGLVSLGGGIGSIVVLLGYHWWAAIALAIAWFSPQWLLRESIRWKDWRSQEVKDNQRAAEYAYSVAVGPAAAKEVRLFGLTDWVVNWFVASRQKLADLSLEAARLRERSTALVLVVMLIANGAFLGLLAWEGVNHRVGLGQLTAFATAVITGSASLSSIDVGWWLHTASRPVPVVLGLKERMAIGALPAGAERIGADGPSTSIVMRDVRFAYPSRPDRLVLSGLNLEIESGRSIAIVGDNGAGKSTIIKLLCRFYDPGAGAIMVDGTDLRATDIAQWRSNLAGVLQDFVRYDLSLRENVAPSGATDEDIEAALEAAGAAGIADLDTVLSKAYVKGTDLSGGQWQRIAIARALCAVRRGARIIILDEPTAHLDVRGEAEIFNRVLESTRGCTTVLISHRFSTVRRVDRIFVLDSGRVIEEGSHDELMALGGRYATMFKAQASRFAEEPEGAV